MFCHDVDIPCPTSVGCPAASGCPIACGCPATIGCPTIGGCAATEGCPATMEHPITLECPDTTRCPTSVGFCSTATCFKCLLPSSKIYFCPAWIACWFLLLAFFANCMAFNVSSSLRSSSFWSSLSWKCNCSSNCVALIGSTTSWFGQAPRPSALCSSRSSSFSRWFYVWSSLYFNCSNVCSKASGVFIPELDVSGWLPYCRWLGRYPNLSFASFKCSCY
jgi:hypothetical protein